MKSYFATHRNPVSILMAMIIVGGVWTYAHMQKSLFPDVVFPKIKIIADGGLQPVDKMTVTVTKPLENAIKKVPGLETVRSNTARGSCEISAFMSWKANVDLAKQEVESRIAEIKEDLPPGVRITVEKMSPSILQVMGYALESKTRSPIEMKHLALYTVKPFLSQVPGVAQIAVSGGKTKEYWVQLDPERMHALSVTPDQVSLAIDQTNFILSNGYVSDYRRLYLTVTNATIHDLSALGDVVIHNDGKRIIRLRDIATITIHPAVEFIRINANGKSSVLIGVLKQPDANLIEVSDGITQKIRALKNMLPDDVTMMPYYNQADFVRDAIHSVSDALWIGVLLAIIVAVLFLKSWKGSAVILISVPATLGLSLIVMYAVGYTLNIMTIGALAAAIALVVDDAIVVVEQIHRTHEEHHQETYQAIVPRALTYLFHGMVASSLSTIVIFIPFAFMNGVAGAYFKVLSNSMIITLACSFVVSWIGIPVVYLLFSRKDPPFGAQQDKTVKPRKWVSYFIRHPGWTLGIMVALALVIVLVAPRLETGFLPDMDEGTIVLDYVTPPGTSLEETDRMCSQMEKIIMAEPEVESYSRRTGTQMGFFITEPNTGDYAIALKKSRHRTTDQVIEDIREKVEASQPAIRVDFGQVIGDMLGDLTTSVEPVDVRIFGADQQRLNALAVRVAGILDSIPGTEDVFDGIVVAGPSTEVIPDAAALAQYGLSPAALQKQVQLQTQGTVIGSILEPQQLTNIRMIYPNGPSGSIADITKEKIFLPGGTLKPLSDLAKVQIEKGATEVQRENLQNMVSVTARLGNRDLGSVMRDIRRAVNSQIFLPRGYHIDYGGAYKEQQKSFGELLMILLLASLLVFCVMLFFSKDILSSLAILLVALLGVAGSVLALFITATPLNVSSYTGLIMIVGIIGENAVFTFLQFSRSMTEGNVDEALTFAISTRLRPKLMTALGAIIALMPLALGIGVGAQLHQPLAIAVIGGFVIALPLLLIVLPGLMRMIYRQRAKRRGGFL